MKNLNLFMQLTKVDAEQRLVYGRAAQEVADKSGEIMDYASSKPNFEKWSNDFEKNTDGKSLGNVRAMHGKVAVGKLAQLSFNDEEKSIDVCAKIVDDQEWKKVVEGVYTGFSIGGSYEKVWQDGTLKRYTAKPSEVSIVDNPCMPTATFSLVKADGVTEEVAFKQPEPAGDIEQVWKCTDGSTFTKKADATAHEADLKVKKSASGAEDLTKKIEQALDKKEGVTKNAKELVTLQKGLYDVSRIAEIICDLNWLAECLAAEAVYEGDNSPAPADLKAIIATLGSFLKALVAEEVSEITGESAAEAEKLDLPALDALAKFTDKFAAVIEKKKTDAEKPVEKVEEGDDLTKVTAERDALKKTLDGITPRLEKALERIEKLEQQPQTPKGSVRVVSKQEDSALSGAAGELQKQLDHGSLSPEQARNAMSEIVARAKKTS